MIPLSKLCELKDFDALRDDFSAVFPHMTTEQYQHRKRWEIVQAYRALRDHDKLHPENHILGVAAGHEETGFWLTNFSTVHMTDLYATPGNWRMEAPPDMLFQPETQIPLEYPWQPKRMIVQHMDARSLRYPDNTFDGVFSSNSIDNFPGLPAVKQSMQEIARVLKPGGICSLTTEYKLAGTGDGWQGVIIFDDALLQEWVIDASGLELTEPIDTSYEYDPAHVQSLTEMVKRARARDEQIYPHYVLESNGYIYTSVSFVLRKPL